LQSYHEQEAKNTSEKRNQAKSSLSFDGGQAGRIFCDVDKLNRQKIEGVPSKD
jgi:hypothetical protein